MITRLRQRVTRPVINHDDSGSMLLALFAITVLTCLVTVVLMTTISQQAKTRKAADFTFAGQAADTAVNDALLMANKGTALTTSGVGVTGDFRWSWSSPPPDSSLKIEITATGCRNNAASTGCTPNSSRRIKAVLSGAVVSSADNGSGDAAYVLTPKLSFTRALFADKSLIMKGSSRVTAYNSATSAQVLGAGQVATNGSADFGPLVRVDGIDMFNTQTYSSGNRCHDYPTAAIKQCDPTLTPRLVHYSGPRLKVSDAIVKAQIANIPPAPVDPDCAPPLKGWVASRAVLVAGRLEPGIQCYSSMTFDMDTTVNGTAEVYVTGPITVVGPVKVNIQNSPTPRASALQIYSSGTVVTLGDGDSGIGRAEVAWALWAPNALCGTSRPAGLVTVKGAMVCQKMFTQGAFIAQWDEALRPLTLAPGDTTIWDVLTYEELA